MRERLGQDVCELLFSADVIGPDIPVIHSHSDEMILGLNVLAMVMEDGLLHKSQDGLIFHLEIDSFNR